jgi:hypothetical protein
MTCVYTRKANALDSGGFVFDYRYGTYVNVRGKMLFSHQLVDSLSPEELEARVAAATPNGEWQFFCLEPPCDSVREQIVEVYAK